MNNLDIRNSNWGHLDKGDQQAFSQDFESGSPNFMWAKGPHSINNHQRAYLFIADGKVAWGQLGKSISLNSGFACEIASFNFDSFDQNRKETR